MIPYPVGAPAMDDLPDCRAGDGARLRAVIGGAMGIGRLAAAAMDGSARQPQVLGDPRTTMIIAAALNEGVTRFALVVCVLLAVKG